MKTIRIYIIGIFIVITAIALLGAGLTASTTKASVVTVDREVQVDLTPTKIAALKADLVVRLSQCESAGTTVDAGLITFDTNHKASIGVLQFQTKTVISTYKAIHGVELTGQQANELALDPEASKALASAIIFGNVQGGIYNWANCANKLGLAQEVAILNKLSK